MFDQRLITQILCPRCNIRLFSKIPGLERRCACNRTAISRRRCLPRNCSRGSTREWFDFSAEYVSITNSTVGVIDMDIYGAFQVCTIAVMASPLTVRLSRTYFSYRGSNIVFFWTALVLAGKQ